MQAGDDIPTVPPVPLPEEVEELEEMCEGDRDDLTPKETADCAGVELVREYESEQDGGS